MAGQKEKNKDTYREYLEKKHKGFETPVELIESVVVKASGSGVAEKSKIVRGEVNEVYDVRTKEDKDIIVRISRMGRKSFETEEEVIRLARSVGVPAPKVLLIEDISKEGNDLTFCVEEKIEGVPLKDIMGTMDKKALAEVLGQAGDILSRIHSVTADKFGPLDGEDQYKTWSEFVYKFERKRDQIVKAGKRVGLDEGSIDRAFRIQSDHLSLFQLKTPKLLHGDFSPKHWLILNGSITGVIDFEDAKGGDPVRDIAWLNFFYNDGFPMDMFLEGYTDKTILSGDFDTKMKLYGLNLGLDLIHYYSSEDNDSGLRYAKRRLIAELGNF